MTTSCVVAGSFDPVTNGHLDVIHQAARLFDRVIVAVLRNTAKRCMFTEQERTDMLRAACAEAGISAEILAWDGLLVDLLDHVGADAIVRGVRDARDFDAERQIAAVNATLRPGTQTVWLASSAANWAVSSTIVRELLTFEGDVSAFVPQAALTEINRIRHGMPQESNH